ncbi:MAG: glycosyltransferase [Lachnospiraceae bacterium]|nr:glycosyltransferase [Lachnospiraceae bacterium]
MNILLYRYGSICEPDMISTFQSLGISVVQICEEITDKKLSAARRVELVSEGIQKNNPVFVFSINFFPAIAEICRIYKCPYFCWTVDSPVPELFSKSVQYDTNRIFLFDRAQYECISEFNPSRTYHLPLAAATERFDKVIEDATESERNKYTCDISFVGSLYSEKNPLQRMILPDYEWGYIAGLTEASLQVYGCNFVEEALTDSCVKAIKENAPGFYGAEDSLINTDRYVAAHSYVGYEIAQQERIRTLNALAEQFAVDIYTWSDTQLLRKVKVHSGVQTLTEMPLVFNRSRINLNMTIKPIQTGLPLRVFDILGCGGFCMTNYQAELEEHFEIGRDLEAYGSLEELLDKCAYYLAHEEERARIAQNGYQKVKNGHGYRDRVMEMLRLGV